MIGILKVSEDNDCVSNLTSVLRAIREELTSNSQVTHMQLKSPCYLAAELYHTRSSALHQSALISFLTGYQYWNNLYKCVTESSETVCISFYKLVCTAKSTALHCMYPMTLIYL